MSGRSETFYHIGIQLREWLVGKGKRKEEVTRHASQVWTCSLVNHWEELETTEFTVTSLGFSFHRDVNVHIVHIKWITELTGTVKTTRIESLLTGAWSHAVVHLFICYLSCYGQAGRTDKSTLWLHSSLDVDCMLIRCCCAVCRSLFMWRGGRLHVNYTSSCVSAVSLTVIY